MGASVWAASRPTLYASTCRANRWRRRQLRQSISKDTIIPCAIRLTIRQFGMKLSDKNIRQESGAGNVRSQRSVCTQFVRATARNLERPGPNDAASRPCVAHPQPPYVTARRRPTSAAGYGLPPASSAWRPPPTSSMPGPCSSPKSSMRSAGRAPRSRSRLRCSSWSRPGWPRSKAISSTNSVRA